MSKQFEISEFDYKKFGTEGQYCEPIYAKVFGYWASDMITLRVTRNWRETIDSGNWSIELSHASGGRDQKELASDLDAELNFSAALVAMVAIGKELESNIDLFESNYQGYLAKRKAEFDAEQKAKQEAFDADTEIGDAYAKQMIDAIAKHANNVSRDQLVTMYKRGEYDEFVPMHVLVQGRMKMMFMLNNERVSKQKLIDTIARYSIRSVDTEVH